MGILRKVGFYKLKDDTKPPSSSNLISIQNTLAITPNDKLYLSVRPVESLRCPKKSTNDISTQTEDFQPPTRKMQVLSVVQSCHFSYNPPPKALSDLVAELHNRIQIEKGHANNNGEEFQQSLLKLMQAVEGYLPTNTLKKINKSENASNQLDKSSSFQQPSTRSISKKGKKQVDEDLVRDQIKLLERISNKKRSLDNKENV